MTKWQALKLDPDLKDFEKFVTTVCRTAAERNMAGEKLTDRDIGIKILGALDTRYSAIRFKHQDKSGTYNLDLTVNDAINSIRAEISNTIKNKEHIVISENSDQNMYSKITRENNNEYNPRRNIRETTIKCGHCHKIGHLERQCGLNMGDLRDNNIKDKIKTTQKMIHQEGDIIKELVREQPEIMDTDHKNKKRHHQCNYRRHLKRTNQDYSNAHWKDKC